MISGFGDNDHATILQGGADFAWRRPLSQKCHKCYLARDKAVLIYSANII